MILEAGVSFKQLKPLPYLNRCRCGSHNIGIIEKSTLGIPNYTIIKCNDCSRGIKRRTYKKAERAWNKNNPMKGGAE